ncbi:MAG: heparinase II/III family protein, partial [Proteobacteria bacterium]|nr:heparinase II/III family protein [Pseudomonadota bacterium]
MIGRIERKFRQLVQDPVLRRWLVRRVLGKEKPEAGEAGPPPYLTGRLPLAAEIPSLAIPVRPATAATALQIGFHGKTVEIDPRCPVAPFADVYEDIETSLAMHRFAWLPFMPAEYAANALTILWPAWRAAHGTPDSSWAWHPYTAAERAINILEFIRTAGWPVGAGGVLDIVSQHAPAIAARLEYFGERGTFNHLANNGLGLHAIGCALAMPGTRAMGFTILAREAERILTPAGVLREGSTHYHFLFTRKYLVAWLAAARAGQADEAGVLLAIAARMVAAAKALALPGGMPLIGDISPDSPPSHLMGLEAGICPWIKRLPEQERQAVAELVGRTASVNSDALLSSGWIRKDSGRFAALASCPPSGWPFMPGHAHQDLGSAEIHFQGKPIFVDPGRGQYGDAGEAALYRSSAAHGTLRIDDQD